LVSKIGKIISTKSFIARALCLRYPTQIGNKGQNKILRVILIRDKCKNLERLNIAELPTPFVHNHGERQLGNAQFFRKIYKQFFPGYLRRHGRRADIEENKRGIRDKQNEIV
jgi:hypothetical protein